MFIVTFADQKYRLQQEGIDNLSSSSIVHLAYSPEWLKNTNFYLDNIHILQKPRGCGYWLWKPYILSILAKTLPESNFLYIDCGDKIHDILAVQYYLENTLIEYPFITLRGVFSQKMYTKRDCFVQMNCDEEKYWDATQIEAGVIAFRNTQDVIKSILDPWLEACTNSYILTDVPNISGKNNFAEFKDHRHDQSILTNLLLKINHPKYLVDNSLRQWITCNAI